jgi:glycosyltransferase involved in cell wall biosynthesis
LRLAHVTHWPVPSDDTATTQLVQTAAALARTGAVVDLVVPRGPGPKRSEPELRALLAAHYGTDCGFGIRQLPTRIPGIAWLSHLLHAGLGSWYASPATYDVVHTRDLETMFLALRLRRRVLFETYRPLTRRSRWIGAVLRDAARRPGLLGIVTHSRLVAEQYAADGIPTAKLLPLYNAIDPVRFATERTPARARELLGWPEGFTVVYAGRIAPLKRIDLLLAAAEASPELQWAFAGRADTPEARPFVARAGRLPNVRFPGFLRGDALTLALQAADVLVLNIAPEHGPRPELTGLPIKVFQYLAAGRPIVAPELPPTAELLIAEQNSVRIPPGDGAALLASLRALRDDPERRRRLGAAARASIAGHTWDARAARLLEFLLERLSAAGRSAPGEPARPGPPQEAGVPRPSSQPDSA